MEELTEKGAKWRESLRKELSGREVASCCLQGKQRDCGKQATSPNCHSPRQTRGYWCPMIYKGWRGWTGEVDKGLASRKGGNGSQSAALLLSLLCGIEGRWDKQSLAASGPVYAYHYMDSGFGQAQKGVFLMVALQLQNSFTATSILTVNILNFRFQDFKNLYFN